MDSLIFQSFFNHAQVIDAVFLVVTVDRCLHSNSRKNDHPIPGFLYTTGMRRVHTAGFRFCKGDHKRDGIKRQFRYQEVGHHRRCEVGSGGSLPEHAVLCRHHRHCRP